MPVDPTKTQGRNHRRIAKTLLAIAGLGSLPFACASTVGAAAPAGGAIRVFATPNGNGSAGPIVFAGAIGDYGKFLTIDQNGKANPNGNYVKITLRKGTFEVNSTTLNAAANKQQPTMNPTSCSAYGAVSDPVTLLDGTGLYKGISGTVRITETFAFILPTFTNGAKKGQCNESNNAQPIAQYSSITGLGTVSFS